MHLRPLTEADDELLTSLEEQEDVWESVGALLLPDTGDAKHLFAVMVGDTAIGVAGLVRSVATGGSDFEMFCALKSEAQLQGYAKQACDLVLAWAFGTLKLERVLSSIDDTNEGARSLALKIGMKELSAQPPHRTLFVRNRDESPVTTA